MIRAVFFKAEGKLSGFELSGHAGAGEMGRDVVCAAVSSSAQLVCNALTDHLCVNAQADVSGNTLTLRLKDGCPECSVKLLDAFLSHLGFISEEYPGRIGIVIKRRINVKGR